MILDTDHLSLLEWEESSPARKLNERLDKVPLSDVCSTVISFKEQTRGWLGAISAAKKVADQIEFYRRLLKTLKMFCGLTILPFDSIAATEYQSIRKQVPRLGKMDQRIAAIALVHKAKVLSRNTKDFGKVPGLIVEDWTR